MRAPNIAEYEAAENEAISALPNRIVEAHRVFAFDRLGYPVRISSESELAKYVDVLQEGCFEKYFNENLSGLTTAEFDKAQEVWGLLSDFSVESFGVLSLARASLMSSLNLYRHIKYLCGDNRARVFEFAAGSGYLGLLLMLDGYPYAASDPRQAFYLFQSHLWRFGLGEKLGEAFFDKQSLKELQEMKPGSSLHLPWWDFASLSQQDIGKFDIVTCNHTLSELSQRGLEHFLSLAKWMLREDEASMLRKAFLFQGWGRGGDEERNRVCESFYRYGFVLVHHDPNIAAFVPKEQEHSLNALKMPHANGKYSPIEYQAKGNPISDAIQLQRELQIENRVIAYDQLDILLTVLLNSEDHRSMDERFLDLIECGQSRPPNTALECRNA